MAKKAAHMDGRVGGPCAAVKGDGFFCSKAAVVVVEGRGYCARHARAEVR